MREGGLIAPLSFLSMTDMFHYTILQGCFEKNIALYGYNILYITSTEKYNNRCSFYKTTCKNN